MEPNESLSYSENREYFQILEKQRQDVLREILWKCDNGPYNGPYKMENTLRTPEETPKRGEGSTGIHPVFSKEKKNKVGLGNSKSNFQYQGMWCGVYALPKSMEEFQPGGMERVNSFTTTCQKIMTSRTEWRELEPDNSKISQDLREIQKTVQDYGHRLIHIPMKIENLSQKMDEILKILPDLQKGLTDLRTEVADLKKNQRDSPETSKSRQDESGTPLEQSDGTIPLKIPKPTSLPEIPKSAIAERLGRLIKIHFIGDGYFEGSRTEKAREYTQALFGLELRNICAVDEYIYWFRKYFFQSGVATEIAAPMFFAKICSPWREMLIQAYKVPEGQLDSVARRMSFLKDKLKDWCYQASIQKNMKRLRGTIKRTPLCCDNNDFLTIIGGSSEPRKRKTGNDSYPRSSRRTSFRRRSWWSKSKARTYKSGQRTGPTRASSQGSRRTDTRSTGRTPTKRTFRRAHTRANESFKECNCWTCGAKGHISPDCPQKRGELRKFEATNDILDAVYYGDLVPVYQFEDIPSDESVYEEEIETDSDGSSTDSEIGGIGKVLNQIGLNQRRHHIIYKVSSGEFAIPMELTGNVMEMQLIPKEEILEELRKLMFDIHPRIAYNLADQDFSRVLTLHQDFKRKDLMKEGNRPYSITYRIAYALSNTHHSDLFLRKEYIEIPRIFKEFAKQPVIGRYEGMLEIAGHEILVTGIAGREHGSMTLGLNFLEEHKPWGRKAYIDSGSGICTAKPGVFPEEAMETLPVLQEGIFRRKS
ncbi:UNVERIFIED_CONTAM: movement protein [Sesamum radiatum]|uniref:Movement protein n=1 Tax=Sesamum radiatum TaxID=300843 RepID=A0AAW2U8V8_SESRA